MQYPSVSLTCERSWALTPTGVAEPQCIALSGELRAMIAKLTVSAQDTSAFAGLDTCNRGLTCANSNATHPNVSFDCGAYDMASVATPEAVSCGRACSARECCVLHGLGDSMSPPDPEDVAAMAKAHHVLNHAVLQPITDCISLAIDDAERCKLQRLL